MPRCVGGRTRLTAPRAGMTAAIAARLAMAGGDRDYQVPDQARDYMGMGIAEMAADRCGYRGHIRTARQVFEVFERAFGHHTTSDFPGILIDAMNVRLLARYQEAMPTYRRFFGRYTASDFRPVNVIRAGDFPSLQEINESGEIKAGTFSESRETFRVHPYGVQFRLTRQMLVNDQLGAIDQVLGSTGARVADWENQQGVRGAAVGIGRRPDASHRQHCGVPHGSRQCRCEWRADQRDFHRGRSSRDDEADHA
jgi:hypothetical protein